jgi:hypothetical protein
MLAMQRRLNAGGILALWCAEHPGEAFEKIVAAVFASVDLIELHFDNPCLRQEQTNYLLLATAPGGELPATTSPC